MRPVGVAIAGLGFGEAVHLPALRACPLTEPVALWHPRQDRLATAMAAADLPGTTDFDELLANPAVEAVVIATPPAPRTALARQALLARRHLLLEKPVALHAADAEDLERLALAQGCVVGVDFEYRAVPLFQQAAALLDQGWIGDPWLLRLDWLMGSRSDPARPWSWYSSRDQGGGVLGALGSHAFDLMAWLVGPVRQVQAQLTVSIPERPLARGGAAVVDAADTALVQLIVEPRWSPTIRSLPVQIALASTARLGRGCWLEIHGSDGTLVLGSSNQRDYVHGFQLQGARRGEPLRVLEPDPALAFARTWSDGRLAPVERLLGWWARAIRGGRPMVPGLLEGRISQEIIDACLRSADGQGTEAVGSPWGPR